MTIFAHANVFSHDTVLTMRTFKSNMNRWLLPPQVSVGARMTEPHPALGSLEGFVPKSGVRIVLDELRCVFNPNLLNQGPAVSQGADLEVKYVILVWMFWILKEG